MKRSSLAVLTPLIFIFSLSSGFAEETELEPIVVRQVVDGDVRQINQARGAVTEPTRLEAAAGSPPRASGPTR